MNIFVLQYCYLKKEKIVLWLGMKILFEKHYARYLRLHLHLRLQLRSMLKCILEEQKDNQ